MQQNASRRSSHPAFPMPIREFTDSSGLKWRVWSTIPLAPKVYEESLRSGWLTFESATGRRRLAPIPPHWEEASVERLEQLCRIAPLARPTGNTPDPDTTRVSPESDERSSGEG